MTKSLIDQIEEANRSFLAGKPSFLSEEGPPFAVVYCFDPRLTGLVVPALGLPRHRTMTIRVAGNRVSAQNHDVVRSVAAAVYLRGAAEILVVGHTDCAMAAFQASDVIEAFRKHNISREAFGDADLRTWFGAIGSIRGNVVESVEFIRKCGIFPVGLPVAGFVIDTVTGKLDRIAVDETVPRTEEAAAPQDAPPPPAPPPVAHAAPPQAPPPVPPAQASRPVVIGEPSAASAKPLTPPDSLVAAGRMLSSVVQRARGNPAFQRDLLELKLVAQREKSPVRLVVALETLARKHAPQYPELPALAAYLRTGLAQSPAGQSEPLELLRRVLG